MRCPVSESWRTIRLPTPWNPKTTMWPRTASSPSRPHPRRRRARGHSSTQGVHEWPSRGPAP
jgi:hypothetical protein